MFEYLMPLLVMRQPAHSLLDLTCRLVVGRQIRYGSERKVPWGVSESAYSVRDLQLTYQYSAFGRARLGAQARAVRGRGRSSLRHRAGGHGQSQGRSEQLCSA